jgi:hypothetical protein
MAVQPPLLSHCFYIQWPNKNASAMQCPKSQSDNITNITDGAGIGEAGPQTASGEGQAQHSGKWSIPHPHPALPNFLSHRGGGSGLGAPGETPLTSHALFVLPAETAVPILIPPTRSPVPVTRCDPLCSGSLGAAGKPGGHQGTERDARAPRTQVLLKL